jgi:hypothetical protein
MRIILECFLVYNQGRQIKIIRIDIMKMFIFAYIFSIIFNVYSQDINYDIGFMTIDMPENMYIITCNFITEGIDELNLGVPINVLKEGLKKQNVVLYAMTADFNSQIEIIAKKIYDKKANFKYFSDNDIILYSQNIISENLEEGIEYNLDSIYKNNNAHYIVLKQSQMVEFLVETRQYITLINGLEIIITFISNEDLDGDNLYLQKKIIDSIVFKN